MIRRILITAALAVLLAMPALGLAQWHVGECDGRTQSGSTVNIGRGTGGTANQLQRYCYVVDEQTDAFVGILAGATALFCVYPGATSNTEVDINKCEDSSCSREFTTLDLVLDGTPGGPDTQRSCSKWMGPGHYRIDLDTDPNDELHVTVEGY